MESLIRFLRQCDESLTSTFDTAFVAANNPWRHLGALAVLCFAIAVTSGCVAFILYDTSVSGAYQSGRRLQQDPMLLGRLLRGLHRYAADAFMLLSLLHLLREFARGHFRGIRWFSWLTGIPLVWLLWIAGITGLWLLWDERALFSITATAEWMHALPLTADLLARNFLSAGALSDRFFSLIMFVHIGVPLLLAGGVWIHLQRLSTVRFWPPKSLALACVLTFSLLALLLPAESLGPADTGNIPATLSLDWYFQFPHPLVIGLSAPAMWLLAAALTLLLAVMPLSRPRTSAPPNAAQVDLANCNGCARCVADCPFGAVVMVARSDHRKHAREASVRADLCAACGICVGACPSATPFRRIEDLQSGIELPALPISALRSQLQRHLEAPTAEPKVVVFACRQAARLDHIADASTAVIQLECAAMLPPSFIEYAKRLGAGGIVIAGCREADCEYRLGDRWLRERFDAVREPRLRQALPQEPIALSWAGNDVAKIRRELDGLRARIKRGAMSVSETNAETPAFNEEPDHG